MDLNETERPAVQGFSCSPSLFVFFLSQAIIALKFSEVSVCPYVKLTLISEPKKIPNANQLNALKRHEETRKPDQ